PDMSSVSYHHPRCDNRPPLLSDQRQATPMDREESPMEQEAMRERAAAVLSAWNSHDVNRVVACYTEDCIYRDPNTRGAVEGHEALRRYLSRLLRDWRMHWSLREFFPFADGSGGAFLWDAELTPA